MRDTRPRKVNRFAGVEAQERIDRHSMRTRNGREHYEDALAWARANGFTEEIAPLAAVVASSLKVQKHSVPITKALVLDRLEREGRA